MKIALMEPYFGGSHRAFAEGYAAASRHDVSLFTHTASFWKWRLQGGYLTLARQFSERVGIEGRFDLIVGSSMLDLSRFLGEARAAVGDAPAVLYMHENQLTYPPVPGDGPDMTYAMANWASAAAADLVLFNSQFHMREWFAALPAFLRRLPDERHTDLVGGVEERCEVMPVGIDLARIDGATRTRRSRSLLLWNHRWEHDKGPDLFSRAVTELASLGLDFDVALAGEQFVSDPTDFAALREALDEHVVHYGWAEPDAYIDLLHRSDIVVSTARQEFFGVAITEAVYAGAFPVLPNALVYPERVPEDVHDRCLYDDHDDLVGKLQWAVSHRDEAGAIAHSLRPTMAAFDWSRLAPQLDARFEELVGE